MAKIENNGSGKSIYGNIPDNAGIGQAKNALNQAMDVLDDSFSNSINGPVKDKRDVHYDPENGE